MTEKVVLNGAELWLEHKGEGKALVFIHGFSLNAQMWDEHFEAFQTTYKVIRYDLRGFGRSETPSESYRHIDDLLAILDYLKLEKVILIGFSLGGGVALDFALTYPDRLEALILVDSILGGYTYTTEWRESNKAIGAAARINVKKAQELWISHALFKPALHSLAAAKLKALIEDYSGWHWKNRDSQVLLSEPAIKRLEQVSLPTLIVVGESDIDDFKMISEILTMIPHSEKEILPNAGHMSSMENPQEFSRVLEKFLKEM